MRALRLTVLKTNNRLIKILEISLITILGLIAILSAVWGLQKYFEGRVYPLVSVQGISLTGQTVQGAQNNLQNRLITPNQKITLVFQGKEKEYTIDELGIEIDFSQTVIDGYKIGREINFIKADKNIDLQFKIDSQSFNQSAVALDENILVDIQDAYLTARGGEIIIVQEKAGQGVDMDKFKADMQSVAIGQSSQVYIQTKIIPPLISSIGLEPAKIRAQKLVDRNIELNYAANKYIPTKEEKVQWLKFEGDKIIFSDEKINLYLENLAKKIDIKAQPQKIYDDGTITEEGKDGLALNRIQALADIKSALMNDSSDAVALTTQADTKKTIRIERPFTPGLYEGKYIEIDLSSQTLFQIEGQNVVGSHRVSSGKAGMRTPSGTFQVLSKVDRAYSPTYNLYMPYWMAFSGSKYGIHELPEWANGYKEGENHLGTPVSHGCVRLGIGNAAQVYGWAEIGTPVYIHN